MIAGFDVRQLEKAQADILKQFELKNYNAV
jgi:hypothetical protein